MLSLLYIKIKIKMVNVKRETIKLPLVYDFFASNIYYSPFFHIPVSPIIHLIANYKLPF